MRPHRHALAGLCLAWALSPSLARAEDVKALFDEAVRYDLEGEGKAPLAFALYRRAAEAGLLEAEFNVAVMLDSGRGVTPDATQAATWYARAATHGHRRAAYDLGQLYEAGEGVPRNADLARAWFSASDLPAARGRQVAPDLRDPDAALSGPVPVAPAAGAAVDPGQAGIEFVWTSRPEPEPVRFLVELRALDPSGSHEVFSGDVGVSAALAASAARGDYAWRVSAVAVGTGRYKASNWVRFKVASGDAPVR